MIIFSVHRSILLFLVILNQAEATQFYYNYIYLDGSKISCDADFNYCVSKSSLSIQGAAIKIWQRSVQQFILLKTYMVQCYSTSCQVSQDWIAQDRSHILVFTSVDGYLKVYAWNNADIKFKQAINITGLSTNTPINNYLLLGSATSLVLYKYNPTTIQYDLIISINSQTGIQKYSISQDSILMAVAKTGFILDIYTITGSSYTVTTLPIPSVPAGSTSVWNLKLRNRSGTYVLIIVFTTGSDHFFSYYVITSTTINLMQVVDQTIYSSSLVNSYNIYDIWLTTNTQYIVAVTSSQTNWILVYQYDSNIDAYLKTSKTFTFNWASGTPNIWISENASFIIDRTAIFYTCTVPYCQVCNWINSCIVCQIGYTLLNNLCTCAVNQSMVGTICVSCQIQYCSYCTANNTCSNCSNGYSLNGTGNCQCASGSTISSSGICVICNVSNCDRCDRTNTCALYSISSSNSSSSNSTNTTTNTSTLNTITNSNTNSNIDKDITTIKGIVIVLMIIIIGLGIGIILIWKKINLTVKNPVKVEDEFIHNSSALDKRQTKGSEVAQNKTVHLSQVNNTAVKIQQINSQNFDQINVDSVQQPIIKRRRITRPHPSSGQL